MTVDRSDFVTVPAFAELVGVSTWTLYEMIKRDELPGAAKFGRAIRIHLPTAMAWITESERE